MKRSIEFSKEEGERKGKGKKKEMKGRDMRGKKGKKIIKQLQFAVHDAIYRCYCSTVHNTSKRSAGC